MIMASCGAVLGSSPSHEKDNFVRLATLLIDGGTKLTRDVLDMRHSPTSVQQVLTRDRASLESIGNLYPDQKEILYPTDGSPAKIDDCDITLLFVLLKEVCNLKIPSEKILKRKPIDEHSTLGELLGRLKLYRNKVFAHVTKLKLSDSEFKQRWDEISSVMLLLAKYLKREDEWKKRISHYRSVTLSAKEEEFVKKLEEWRERDKDVLAEVQKSRDEMKEAVEEIKERLDELPAQFKEIYTGQPSRTTIDISREKEKEGDDKAESSYVGMKDWKKGTPTFVELDNIARNVVDCWKSLGRRLGVPQSGVDNIIYDNVNYSVPREKAFRMLQIWSDKGRASTYAQLANALCDIGKDTLVKTLCQD